MEECKHEHVFKYLEKRAAEERPLPGVEQVEACAKVRFKSAAEGTETDQIETFISAASMQIYRATNSIPLFATDQQLPVLICKRIYLQALPHPYRKDFSDRMQSDCDPARISMKGMPNCAVSPTKSRATRQFAKDAGESEQRRKAQRYGRAGD